MTVRRPPLRETLVRRAPLDRRRARRGSVRRAGCVRLAIAVVSLGCVGGMRSQVRDLDGRPVPLYSVAAHGPAQKVRCADGHDYVVLTTPPPPFLVGASFGTVLRQAPGDISTVCDRILAN